MRIQRANYHLNMFYDMREYGFFLKQNARFIEFVMRKIDENYSDEEIQKILRTKC